MNKQFLKTKVVIEKEWVSLREFAKDVVIDNNIQTLHCDTRDFYIIASSEKPKIYEKVEYNYERLHNEGISKLHNLFFKKNRENYTISSNEIISFLFQLCETTGGFDKTWRYIDSDVKNCSDWTLKYIRFVRNNKYEDEFIVCNAYLTPIKYKEIISNLHHIID